MIVGARYERDDDDESDLGDEELLTEGADLETLGDREKLGAREKDERLDERGAENERDDIERGAEAEREGADRLTDDPDRWDDDPVDRAPQAVPAARRASTVAAAAHRMRLNRFVMRAPPRETGRPEGRPKLSL